MVNILIMEKIDLVEILKDCPTGMELDCTLYDNCTFEIVYRGYLYPIQIQTPEGSMNLTKYGSLSSNAHSKCVIFPKGRTTWEGFVPPCKFKDGDIITCTNSACSYVAIFKEMNTDVTFKHYVSFTLDDEQQLWTKVNLADFKKPRFATGEEKEKLFKAIKNNGYKWNAETKTLEKLIEPKFKVGDKVRHKKTNKDDVYEISKVYDDSYGLVDFTWVIYMKYQDYYELVPGKFDINTLIPFESRVLVRDNDYDEWKGAFWSHLRQKADIKYDTIRGVYRQCIPYNDDTKHLLGKTNSCDEYFKNWK